MINIINIVSYTSTGKLHKSQKVNCQDKTYSVSKGGIHVISLADGAGSLSQAEVGATIASESAVECIYKLLFQYNSVPTNLVAPFVLNDVICKITQKADDTGNNPKDYGSTLICLGIYSEQILMFHLGDGAIAVWGKDYINVVSYPTNILCKECTHLTTSYRAEMKAKVKSTCGVKGSLGYMLISDGAYAVMFDESTGKMTNECWRYLQCNDFSGLNYLLSSSEVNTDDKSYIACYWNNYINQ